MRRFRLGWPACAAIAALVVPLLAFQLSWSAGPPDTPASAPNIVLILTDDQRADTLWAMPNVQEELVDRGVSFSNAFAVNPWCCPSRANILTGQYSHTNGVWRNSAPYGGFASFKDGSTLATWLQSAGYHTGLIGKYFNGYENSTYLPPGWDRWVAFNVGTYQYFNYKLNIDGVVTPYGTGAANYSTDVLRDHATSFIRNTSSREPFFLYFTPNAPHGTTDGTGGLDGLPEAAPRHATSFSDLPLWRPPSFNEADVSEKPAHIQALPTINPDNFRSQQYKSLLAVDDAVKAIVDTLRDTGRLENTMIIFASDNGMLWGEHRWGKKVVPYEESIRIPLLFRYDPVTSGLPARSDTHLVNTTDLAPTIAEAANIGAPGAEGASLMPILSGADPPWRSDFLIEHLQGPAAVDPIKTYCAVRNERHIYVVYKSGERELYDLSEDPYQLTNRAADPAYAATVDDLHARLKTLCTPPPPGFVLPN
jgi:arylsulfatase A-like enzyme